MDFYQRLLFTKHAWLLALLMSLPLIVHAQQGVVVGDATANPNATLDVRGDAIVEDTDPLAPGYQVLGRDANGLIGTVDILSGTGLAADDILVWDGTQWVAGQQQTLNAGTAIDITGGVVSGDYQSGDLIDITGDVIGVIPPTTGTGEYLRWDGTNWSLGDPTQNYTGDAYITVDNLAGTIAFNASPAVPNPNDVLVWDGTQWVPQAPSAGTVNSDGSTIVGDGSTANPLTGNYAAGTGIDITGNTISGDYVAGSGIDITGNTITGNYTNADPYITVDNTTGEIGFNDNGTLPNTGDVIVWDGTTWEPQASAGGTVSADGVTITGDGSTTNPLTGAYTSPDAYITVDNTTAEIDFNDNGTPPAANDVLLWTGTSWAPTDASTLVTAGPGIDITGNVIRGDYATNTPDYLTIDNATGTVDFNVDPTAPADGDVLVWDNANSRWAAQASAASTVNTEAPITGDGSVANPVAIAAGAAATPVLTWDGTDWVNGNYNGLRGITVTGLDVALPQGGVAAGLTAEDSVLTWDPGLSEWTPGPVRGATITEQQVIIGTGTPGDSVRLADAVNTDDFIRWDNATNDWVIDTFIGWKTEGNLGTDPAVNYLGTGDAQDLVFRTDDSERMRVLATGNVGIGTTTPDYLLHQEGETGHRVTINALAQTATYYANLREITVPSATDSVVGTRTNLTVNSPGAEVNGLNIRTAVTGTPTTSRVSGISVEARTNSPANNNEAGVGVEAYGTYIGANTTVTASIEDMPAVAGIGGRAQVPDLSRAVVAVGGGGTAYDPQQGYNAGLVGSAADGDQGNLGIGGAANGSISQYYSVVDAMPVGSGVGVGGFNPMSGPNEWGLYIDGRTRHTFETTNLTSTFNANVVDLTVQNATDSVIGTRTDVTVQDAQGVVKGLNVRTGVSGAPTQERVSAITAEALTNTPASNNEAGVGVEAYGTYVGANTTVTASIEDMPAVVGLGGRAQVPDLSRAVVAVGGGGTAYDPQQGYNAGLVGSAADGDQGNLGIGGAANGSISQYYSVVDAMPVGSGVGVGGYNPMSGPGEWGLYIDGRTRHTFETTNLTSTFKANVVDLSVQNATDSVIGTRTDVKVQDAQGVVKGLNVRTGVSGAPTQERVSGITVEALTNSPANNNEAAVGVEAYGTYSGANTTVTASIEDMPAVVGLGGRAQVPDLSRAVVAVGGGGTAYDPQQGYNAGIIGSAADGDEGNLGIGGAVNGTINQYYSVVDAMPSGAGVALGGYNPLSAPNEWGSYIIGRNYHSVEATNVAVPFRSTTDELTIQNASDTVIGTNQRVDVENGGPFVIGERVISRTSGVPSQSAVYGIEAIAESNIPATSGAQEFAAGVKATATYTGPNTSTSPITAVPGVLGSYNEALVADPSRAAVAMGSFGTAFQIHQGSNSGLVGSASGAAGSNIGLGGVANGSFGAYIAFGSSLPAGFGAAILGFNPNPAANNYGLYAEGARHRLNGELQMEGNITPTADATYNLGSAASRFDEVFAQNGVINTSDRRLKTNIVPMRYGLKEIMALEPVQYNWKATPEGELKLGLIAQDVQNVVDEVVHVDDRNAEQRLGLNYAELIPVLINGMKEQQAIIDAQQNEIEALKAESEQAEAAAEDVETLKAELEELKSAVETLNHLNGVQAEQR